MTLVLLAKDHHELKPLHPESRPDVRRLDGRSRSDGRFRLEDESWVGPALLPRGELDLADFDLGVLPDDEAKGMRRTEVGLYLGDGKRKGRVRETED